MGRELKTIKARLENLIITVWRETNRGRIVQSALQAIVINAIFETLKHFETEDYLYGSQHTISFSIIYLSVGNFRQLPKNLLFEVGADLVLNTQEQGITYSQIIETAKINKNKLDKTKLALSQKSLSTTKTLSRHTNIYIKCFEKKLKEILNK